LGLKKPPPMSNRSRWSPALWIRQWSTTVSPRKYSGLSDSSEISAPALERGTRRCMPGVGETRSNDRVDEGDPISIWARAGNGSDAMAARASRRRLRKVDLKREWENMSNLLFRTGWGKLRYPRGKEGV